MNTQQIEDAVRKILIRRDGRLNSPAICSSSNKWLIEKVQQTTSFLPEGVCFAQRWWHLLNGSHPPKCLKCNNYITWNNYQRRYNTYCTQYCAVTSESARVRAHNCHIGRKHTIEHCEKQSISRQGHQHSAETKKKLSERKRGSLNPSYGKPAWNRGLVGILNPRFGVKRPGSGRKGINNPQYGIPPSKKAGKGIWGKYNGYHFRSSLELMYLIYWHQNNICVQSAEKPHFRVEYINEEGVTRTYSPDFFLPVQNELIELKPENLHTNKQVQQKFTCLKNKHNDKTCKLLGFKHIGDFIRNLIYTNKIDRLLKDMVLVLNDKQLERLKRNYGDIIRATV